ncbi:uncharacterized protein ATNIH1004_011327 [Aspergillus tanneri]|uniref:Cytochrome P450-dit2 n=1 Tax=Aspergillus tanneri TaxID=1220188 RepID=A0A5M9MBT8_9EURO|nr:uncharacterized protein ATNIH1004_011327 [Aspergillus tanneri]KAA8642383.1 hypothetical protein ATNIH1004_011327 [Aspergillus tanneri]
MDALTVFFLSVALLLGPNILSWPLPVNDIAETFQVWTRKYGPIVSVKIGGRDFIILGTREAAQDILEKRARIYSSRPPSKFLDKYLHKGLSSAFMPYGPEWQLHRRLSSNLLNAKASNAYRYLQDIESKQLLHEFLSSHDFQYPSTDIPRELCLHLFTEKEEEGMMTTIKGCIR